ncbi:MAG: hypothetical protein Q8M03_09020 [Legionella sp.]|nr:hypothetical protein [Legionella sp.]
MTDSKKSPQSAVNPDNRNSDSANPGNMYPKTNREPKHTEKKGIKERPHS